MARPKLTLFLDIVSPFAYMAWYVTKNSPTFAQCDVTYIPIFLGGVMQACGNTPPINIKNKGEWIGLERVRWAKQFNIPICEKTPEPFPQSTLQAMRALSAISLHHPAHLTACFATLYTTFWVHRNPISQPQTWTAALTSVLGETSTREIVRLAGEAEAKELLKANTDLAVREGAFGLPWFVATDAEGRREGFWGFDHLGQVVDFLGLERKHEGFRAML